ncbi:MAG: DUF3667 domain-containing protein [Lysobacter sp.]|nr:DUF3667 domain-containing protein [Lysobacter sp.]
MTDHAATAPPAACENCATALIGGYCHVCGQRAHSPLHHFGHAIEEVFESFWHLDGRIFRTLRDLFVPGRVATGYLAGHRVRYVAPLRLFIILSLITFFVGKLTLHIDSEDAFQIDTRPAKSGIVVGDVRIDESNFRNAKTVDEVIALRTKFMGEVAAENRKSGPGPVLSALYDFAKRKIDDKSRARMLELGATPEQLRRLDTPFDAGLAPTSGTAAAAPPEPSSAPAATVATSGSQDLGVVERWFVRRIEKIQENADLVKKNPDELLKRFLGAVPGALFVLMPLFALCLKLLYIGSGRSYLEHLVVALYSHAFMLVGLLFAFLLIGVRAIPGQPAGVAGFSALTASFTLFLLVPLYLLWMQKRVYAQNWLKTLTKYATLGLIYSFLLGMAIMYAVLAGLSS